MRSTHVLRLYVKERQAVESSFMEMAQNKHCGSRKKWRVGGEITVEEEVMVDEWLVDFKYVIDVSIRMLFHPRY
jgi:hypothetical protein